MCTSISTYFRADWLGVVCCSPYNKVNDRHLRINTQHKEQATSVLWINQVGIFGFYFTDIQFEKYSQKYTGNILMLHWNIPIVILIVYWNIPQYTHSIPSIHHSILGIVRNSTLLTLFSCGNKPWTTSGVLFNWKYSATALETPAMCNVR